MFGAGRGEGGRLLQETSHGQCAAPC
jgi:hypothetical protein